MVILKTTAIPALVAMSTTNQLPSGRYYITNRAFKNAAFRENDGLRIRAAANDESDPFKVLKCSVHPTNIASRRHARIAEPNSATCMRLSAEYLLCVEGFCRHGTYLLLAAVRRAFSCPA